MIDKDLSSKESPEALAYQLMQHVLEIEKVSLDRVKQRWGTIPRTVILDIYAECLEAVRGERKRKAPTRAVYAATPE